MELTVQKTYNKIQLLGPNDSYSIKEASSECKPCLEKSDINNNGKIDTIKLPFGFTYDGEINRALKCLDVIVKSQLEIERIKEAAKTYTPLPITFSDIQIRYKDDIFKKKNSYKLTSQGSTLRIQGMTDDSSMARADNIGLSIPKGSNLVVKVQWKKGESWWGRKAFKIIINKEAQIPRGNWYGGNVDNFFISGMSGNIVFPGPINLDSIMVVTGAGEFMDYTLSFLTDGELSKNTISTDQTSKSAFATSTEDSKTNIKILKDMIAGNKRDHYSDSKSGYYKRMPDLLVVYEDAPDGHAHTEGQAYADFLLTQTPNKDAQKLFDEHWKASEKYFPNMQGSSILGWIKKANDSAMDADTFRMVNIMQAHLQQKSGAWGSSDIKYLEEAKMIATDIINKGTLGFANNRRFLMSGVGNSAGGTHEFLIEQNGKKCLMFNPSYSVSYAANMIKQLADNKDLPKETRDAWEQIINTQNEIQKEVISKYGVVDWCVVEIDKNGDFQVSDKLDFYNFPTRNTKNQITKPTIEWPRLVYDHVLNYQKTGDKASLEILRMIVDRYGADLKGREFEGKVYSSLKYSGYRNDLVVALSTAIKTIFNDLDKATLDEFKDEVFGQDDCYGSKYYEKACTHTFQQFLIGGIMKGIESKK